MKLNLYILLGPLLFGILIGAIWRISSRQWSVPLPAWLRWLVEIDNPFTKTNRANAIIDGLSLKAGMSVLDAGCGPGRLTIPLAKKIGVDGKVTAVDIQSRMLDRVKEKATANHLFNIDYLQVKIGDGKLKNHQYDRALLVTVLGEISDREKALKEIFEALKPGGLLSVTEIIFDPHFQRRSTVSRLTIEAGFQVKKTTGNFLAFTMLLEKPKR
jgi:ubiquinone/menaquinone biosynthesis C-methylase UbiE